MEINGTFCLLSLLAVGLHELAHAAMARNLGLKVKRVGICWKGAYIVRESGTPMVNGCVALAGPLTNLALAIAFHRLWPGFAELNLVLGLFNLIPFKSSDGHRALQCWKETHAAKLARRTPPNRPLPTYRVVESE